MSASRLGSVTDVVGHLVYSMVALGILLEGDTQEG